MRILSVPENRYDNLPEKIKIKRAKLLVKLVTMLELEVLYNPDKIRDYVEIHILEDDFDYMSIEEVLLLRCQGFLDNSKIYELYPEEFDYLEGIPVLMWDEL